MGCGTMCKLCDGPPLSLKEPVDNGAKRSTISVSVPELFTMMRLIEGTLCGIPGELGTGKRPSTSLVHHHSSGKKRVSHHLTGLYTNEKGHLGLDYC